MFKHCLPLRGVNGESKVNSQRQFIRLFSLIAFAVVSVVGVSNKVDAYGVSPWVDTSGPGGGTVYYYSASGFSCGVSLSQVCNYLEVAGTDWNAQNRFWDSTKSRDVSGTSQEIGTGAKNTSLIVASNSTTGFAATDPDAFVSNSGHGDWFLPSLKEAQNMDNANYSTDFGEVGTSSQVNSSIWYTYDSRTTRTISDSPKREAFKILAVRAFGKSDSSLSGLQVSGEALSPSFNPSVLEYSLTTSQSTVRISPVAVGAKSTLVGSQSVSNGQQSNPIALATGVNQVVLRVTAADGASTTYTVNITKNNSVQYDGNGSTGGSAPGSQTKTNGVALTLTANTGSLVKSGYTFAGWNTQADGLGTSYAVGASYAVEASLTLFAQWSANSLTVSFDSQGGSSVEAGSTVTGGSIAASPGSPTRVGYTFTGWFTGSSGGSAVSFPYSHGQTASFSLFAQWSVITFAVTFSGNGSTGGSAPGSQTKTHGVALTLAANTGSLVKSGYTFAGWNTQADGSGTAYAASASYTADAILALFAQWTANTLTVTYNSQSGGTIADGSTVTGGAIAASPGSPTRVGYTFTGWFAASSGGSAVSFPYTHGQTASFSLFAQWSANSLTVSFDSQGGSSVEAGSTVTGGSIAASPGSPTRVGYTFTGWFAASSGGSAVSFPYTHGQTASFSLFAQWSANSYSITYDSNSASSGAVPATGSYTTGGVAYPLATNSGSLARTGYAFVGWNTQSDGSGTSYVAGSGTLTPSLNLTLFAQWTANTLTVTYNSQSGSTIAAGSTVTGGSIAASPGSPTRAGYTFTGWFAASSGGSAVSFPYTHGQTASFSLFAQWSANSLTVSFDSQGGSSVEAGSTVTGGSIAASPGSPTRVGYTFTGWFAASSGGSAVSFPYTHGQTASFSLFAQWIQSSLYGLGSKTKIGTITTADGVGNTFAAETATSSVSLRYPAGGLPAGTVIDIYLVNDLTRAGSLLEREGGFVVSLVVAWVAADGSVPLTVSDKPISMTIANDTIKAGAKTYAIVGGVVILLGTATSNGAVTVLIREDPEIVVVNPSSVTAPVASPGASDEDRPAVVSPVLSPRAPSSKSPSPVANLVPIIPGAPSKISGILKIPKSGTIGAPAVFNPQVNANGQTQRKIITPVQITTVPIDAPPAPLGAKVVPIGSMIVASKETPNQANSRVEIGEAKATFGGQPIVPSIQKSNNGIALLTAGPANIAFAGLSSSSSSTNSENPAGATSPSDGLAASASVPLEIATSSFIASSPVQVWLFSTPLLLAETTVDADGNFSVAIKIPKSLRRGNHTLQIQGFVYTSSGAAEVNANLGISVVEAVESKWSMTFQPYVASISKNNISSWKKFVSSQATPLPNCSITVVSPSKNTTENKKLFQNRQASLFTMLRFNGCIDVAVSKLDKSTKSTALDRTWTVDIYPATRSIDFKWAHDFKTYSANIDRKQVLEWSTLLAESNSSKMICSVIGTEPLTESKANTRLFEARNERIKKYLLSNGCSSVDFGTPISRNEKLASRTIWKVEAKAKS
jgi:uncharacterized repeat protein (TIGR02543 family)